MGFTLWKPLCRLGSCSFLHQDDPSPSRHTGKENKKVRFYHGGTVFLSLFTALWAVLLLEADECPLAYR